MGGLWSVIVAFRICNSYTKVNPMGGSRGGGLGIQTPLKSQKCRFFSNTGTDPMENHKATKLAFNIWPISARQEKASIP